MSAPGQEAPDRDVTVNAGDFTDLDLELLERAVTATLDAGGAGDAEVSLTLLDDDGIRALNARWLERDRPTDVIAFTLGTAPVLLGDVYLGVEQARRQAVEYGVPLAEELVRLAVHGTLHVLGHDHPEGAERVESPMFALQEELVRALMG